MDIQKEIEYVELPSPVATDTKRSSKTTTLRRRWLRAMSNPRLVKGCRRRVVLLRESALKAAKNASSHLIGPDIESDVIIRRLAETGENSTPKGYPNLAAFLDSDENFMMYRRFGYLQSRLLLEKQNSLRVLEDKLDKFDQQADPKWLASHNIPEEHAKPRNELIEKIEKKFCEYSNVMRAARQFTSLNKPTGSEYRSLRNYFDSKAPLVAKEASWVLHKEDLVTLRPGRDHAWLDAGIEKLLRWTHCGLIEWLFCNEYTRKKSSGVEIYYTRPRIERLVVSIITVMILALLIVPIWVLYHLVVDNGDGRAYAICIGVLLVSTLAFSAVLSLFTRAKRHEILAAAAAYCAVLVVFLGNAHPNSG